MSLQQEQKIFQKGSQNCGVFGILYVWVSKTPKKETIMGVQMFFAILVNGVEAKRRVNHKDAMYIAKKLRAEHGAYNVWLRPVFELVRFV